MRAYGGVEVEVKGHTYTHCSVQHITFLLIFIITPTITHIISIGLYYIIKLYYNCNHNLILY
jgi:hypothetical protein